MSSRVLQLLGDLESEIGSFKTHVSDAGTPVLDRAVLAHVQAEALRLVETLRTAQQPSLAAASNRSWCGPSQLS
eukprot:m51a1_g7443 hypothetical protein (74) ;mRNA; f:91590-91811